MEHYGSFRLSPDGSRLAVEIRRARSHIWIFDLARRERWALTSEGSNWGPVWTHDGEEVFFASLRDETFGVYRARVEPGGRAVKLIESPTEIRPQSLSRGGEVLLLDGGGRVSAFRLGEDRREILLDGWGPRFSPDSHWIAYTSYSGRTRTGEVFVIGDSQPAGKPPFQVSRGGGEEPIWSADGTEIFYRSGNRWLAVTVKTDPEFEVVAAPRTTVVEGRYVNVPGFSYDHDPRRDRFLLLKLVEEEEPVIRVITNWFGELNALVPPGR